MGEAGAEVDGEVGAVVVGEAGAVGNGMADAGGVRFTVWFQLLNWRFTAIEVPLIIPLIGSGDPTVGTTNPSFPPTLVPSSSITLVPATLAWAFLVTPLRPTDWARFDIVTPDASDV